MWIEEILKTDSCLVKIWRNLWLIVESIRYIYNTSCMIWFKIVMQCSSWQIYGPGISVRVLRYSTHFLFRWWTSGFLFVSSYLLCTKTFHAHICTIKITTTLKIIWFPDVFRNTLKSEMKGISRKILLNKHNYKVSWS